MQETIDGYLKFHFATGVLPLEQIASGLWIRLGLERSTKRIVHSIGYRTCGDHSSECLL
jgi:hypothetical protein